MEEVKLFGKKIEFALPLGVNERISENFIAALRQIEKRTDLAPFISAYPKLIPRGGMRIEFTIQKDRKETKYSATPEQVLRVDQEPSTQLLHEWKQSVLNRSTLERQLRDAVKQDTSLQDEQRLMIEKMIYGKDGMGEMMMYEMRGKGKEITIPEKYQAVIDQIDALRKQEETLKE